jgi:hypothetical protein
VPSTSPDALDAALRIELFLLSSGIQIAEGPHRGSVAGWLDQAGAPEFTYFEITGYYMTAMSWLAAGGARSAEGRERALERGAQALGWAAAATVGGAMPPTRLYLRDSPDDWRNAAVFSFDLAMAARGAACFGAVADAAASPAVVDALAGWLWKICGGEAPLASHALRDGSGIPLLARWSTQPGPHHLKTAAALLRLGDGSLRPELERACTDTVSHWAERYRRSWPCAESHPLLYGLEGLALLGDEESVALAEEVLERLFKLQAPDGSLPANVSGDASPVRSDVLAQALRLAALLRRQGRLPGEVWSARLNALADSLLGYVRADGSVEFANGQGIANAWCAMFAHQALTLYSPSRDEPTLTANAIMHLV